MPHAIPRPTHAAPPNRGNSATITPSGVTGSACPPRRSSTPRHDDGQDQAGNERGHAGSHPLDDHRGHDGAKQSGAAAIVSTRPIAARCTFTTSLSSAFTCSAGMEKLIRAPDV
jgi:hypothetical protein